LGHAKPLHTKAFGGSEISDNQNADGLGLTLAEIPSRPIRKRLLVTGVLALILLTAGLAGWRYTVDNPAPPPASASVSTVAAVYLKAAKAQNCGLTRELTIAPEFAWCDDPQMLRYSSVGKPYLNQYDPGDAVNYCVDFILTNTASSDGTMTAGSQPWSLCFVHRNVGWRLLDQGFG
jgi:hypothetical protein